MADHLHSWIENGGVMGKRIYEKDWAQNPLGAIDDWPDALLNTIPMVVETRFPALICWGDELAMIYNDAYSRLLQDKPDRSEEHTSELQSRFDLVCRLLLEKKKKKHNNRMPKKQEDRVCE